MAVGEVSPGAYKGRTCLPWPSEVRPSPIPPIGIPLAIGTVPSVAYAEAIASYLGHGVAGDI